MKRWQKIALWVLGIALAIVALAVAGFVVWGLTPQGPGAAAEQAMVTDTYVSVSESQGVLYFQPSSVVPTEGVVFYPGGHVDAASYAPLARALAEKGQLVAVPKMPLSLAFFGINAAADIAAANPHVERWILAGHSLGGIAATTYAARNPEQIGGLVLLASYPSDSTDLSSARYPAEMLRGSNDLLVTDEDLASARGRMPSGHTVTVIEGGNHAQFGDYGPQSGDGTPTISPQQQIDATVEAFMRAIDQSPR